MSEVTKFDAQKKKMDGLCEEHDLNYRFHKDSYPITLTVSPIQGVGVQMSMLDETDGEDYISPGASLTLIFSDGELSSKVSGGTFTISKTLRSKLENIFLKMVAFWTQYFFRDVIEHNSLRKGMMPVINEDDANDSGEEDEPDEDDDQDDGEAPDEDLITAATQLVRYENKASIRLLAQRLNIGLSMAGRLMDVLEARGIVGPLTEGGKREVLPHDVPEEG